MIRYKRRLGIYLCCLSSYLLFCFTSLAFVHHLWCSSRDLNNNSYFCPSRPAIVLVNDYEILENGYSLCSIRSARRGPNQRVIGVSAYLSREDNHKLVPTLWTFLLEYVEEARINYPDWIIRIYYFSLNVPKDEIFRVEDEYQNVDFCDSTNIPFFGNILSWYPGKMQRFLPIVDPLVDMYMSRDLDSPILERETTIVRQWLQSNQTIHLIRDHPEHAIPILGGLWGIKLNEETSWRRNMSRYLLTPDFVRRFTAVRDQDFLEQFLWPHIQSHKDRLLAFDSFSCERFPESLPFPTRKESPTRFVGCRRPNCTGDKHGECPQVCRPRQHPDWIWC